MQGFAEAPRSKQRSAERNPHDPTGSEFFDELARLTRICRRQRNFCGFDSALFRVGDRRAILCLVVALFRKGIRRRTGPYAWRVKVSGNLAAAPDVGWQAGLVFDGLRQGDWQALLLELVLGAGIEALLPRRWFDTRKCPLPFPLMMCTCCSAP